MAVIDNKDTNIVRQELTTELDERGRLNIHLQTQVSMDEAIKQVELDNEGGGRIGKGSDEMVIVAEIPMEMWSYDPLLKKAAFFRAHGDKALYTHYFTQFCKLNPQLCPRFQPRVFTTK